MVLLGFPGCLLVRTSEHIITLKEDGSGEGIVHLVDIRSDASSDSLVRRDFDDLMAAYGAAHVEEFEKYGRQITRKRLRVRGDTLMAEITYAFRSLRAIEGLRATKDEFILVFDPDREVVRTNEIRVGLSGVEPCHPQNRWRFTPWRRRRSLRRSLSRRLVRLRSP
ncbi:MAG: hypothetical protein HW412_104 [Bacteroidetes bacterium]|nr:hypothetical protein [Bacteroidota bacterium]